MAPSARHRSRKLGVGLLGTLGLGWLIGCTVPSASEPEPTPPAEPSPTSAPLPDEVRDRVLEFAAQDLDAPSVELTITESTPVVWPDGCLGLGEPTEICTQALVEGWQVEVTQDRQTATYRTSAMGEQIRRDRTEQ